MANTFDDIITCSYKEYHQIILNYITYRITHRCEAEDLAQDVFVLKNLILNSQLKLIVFKAEFLFFFERYRFIFFSSSLFLARLTC